MIDAHCPWCLDVRVTHNHRTNVVRIVKLIIVRL